MADDPSPANISAEDQEKLESRDFLRYCLRVAKVEAELIEDIADACEINDCTAYTLATGDLTVSTAADRLFLTEEEAALLLDVCKAEVAKVAAGAPVPSGTPPATAPPPVAKAPTPAPAPVPARATTQETKNEPNGNQAKAPAPTPASPRPVASSTAAVPVVQKPAVTGVPTMMSPPSAAAVLPEAGAPNDEEPTARASPSPAVAAQDRQSADSNADDAESQDTTPVSSSHFTKASVDRPILATPAFTPTPTPAYNPTPAFKPPPTPAYNPTPAPSTTQRHSSSSIPAIPASTPKTPGRDPFAPSKTPTTTSSHKEMFASTKTPLSLSKSVTLTTERSTFRKDERRVSAASDTSDLPTTPLSARTSSRPRSAAPQVSSTPKVTPPSRPLSAHPLGKSMASIKSPTSNGFGSSSGYVPSYQRATEAYKARLAKTEEPVEEKKNSKGGLGVSGFISRTLLKPTQSFMAWTTKKDDKPDNLSKSTSLSKNPSSKSTTSLNPNALNSAGKPRVTKPQPFHLSTEKRAPKEKLPSTEELALQRAREEKLKKPGTLNKSLSKSMDNLRGLSKSTDNLRSIKEGGSTPNEKPFQLASVERHQRAQEEIQRKLEEQRRQEAEARTFKARPFNPSAPKWEPKLPSQQNGMAFKPFQLASEQRASHHQEVLEPMKSARDEERRRLQEEEARAQQA